MSPQLFIKKWSAADLKERSAAQEHFLDLCRLVGHPTPAEADPAGDNFCFERGATKTGGGNGWADVWKRGAFGWEYKGKGKDLNAAFAQLQRYAIALENPPLLVVSDLATIIIHKSAGLVSPAYFGHRKVTQVLFSTYRNHDITKQCVGFADKRRLG